MRLIYKSTGQEVKVGDIATTFRGEDVEVVYFKPPHKPSSEGSVTVKEDGVLREYYVSTIGAEWTSREDIPLADRIRNLLKRFRGVAADSGYADRDSDYINGYEEAIDDVLGLLGDR